VVGVVLTGARDDGTAGLAAIKRRGGVAVVQDPDDALFASMPEHAMEYVDVDHCQPLEMLPPLLDRLCREPAVSTVERGAREGVTDNMEFEAKIAGLDPEVVESGEHVGELVGFTCPECAGPLYEINDGKLVRFRCRVGHAFTAEDALDGKLETLESALYAALNILEESAEMADRLAARSRQQGHSHATSRFEDRSRDARRQAATIRAALVPERPTSPADAG
jgi:two-component system chemotaxis response regulator CheB